jgi:hypothetical protein
MPLIDVKGFNKWQDEILVVDQNLNDEVDASDEFIALNIPDMKKGSKISWNHPRFKVLRDEYVAFLKAQEEEKRIGEEPDLTGEET